MSASIDELRALLRKGAHGLGLGDKAPVPLSREQRRAAATSALKGLGATAIITDEAIATERSICYHRMLSFKDGRSDKFYNIRVVSVSSTWELSVSKTWELEIEFGRRGGTPTVMTKSTHASVDSAIQAADKLAAQKNRKGYTPVKS